MAELPGADVEVGSAPDRGWVWRCTDASIEKGQVSVLSVIETFWALGLYGVLVWYFGHYWWLLITAFAAPVILLRSEASVNLGLNALRNYANKTEKNLSKLQIIAINALSVLTSFVLCHWLGELWLLEYQSWSLFWASGLIGIVSVISTFAIIGFFLNTVFGIFSVGSTVISAFIGSIGSSVISGNAIIILGVFFGVLITIMAGFGKLGRFAQIVFMLPIIQLSSLGMWFRTLLIQILSALRTPLHGIDSLPLNFHRTCWCKDFYHLPELIPQAMKVDYIFTVRGLLNQLSSPRDKILPLILIPTWYILDLLWRWSLKAALWLWWPLALILKKTFQTENMPQIRDAIVTIVAGWWKWLLMPIPIIIPWLLSGYFPEISSWIDIMPNQVDKPFDKLVSYAVPAPDSLRYAAIWLVCFLSIVVWFKANDMKSQHPMIIGDETYIIQHDIENDPKYSELKQKFYRRAEGIARWHTWRIVSFILLGYSYILYLAYAWYPEQAGRVIPEWLVPYL